MRIYDPQQKQEVSIQDGLLHLEEDRSYHLFFSEIDRPERVFLDLMELDWRPDLKGFFFEIRFWAGRSTLRLQRGYIEECIPVEVQPRPEKLSENEWLALLEDLEAWLPGLTVGLEGGRVGAVSHEGVSLPLLTEALLPLIPLLLKALRVLVAAPREATIDHQQEVKLHELRRAGPSTLRWFSRHPNAQPGLDGWALARGAARDLRVPQQTSRDTLDHPANRYIVWLLQRVIEKLSALRAGLLAASLRRSTSDDAKTWCEARAQVAQQGAQALESLIRSTFLRNIPAAPMSEAAMLTIQGDATYARVQAIARRFLSPMFRLEAPDQEALGASLRPTYSLYELWVFVALYQALRIALPEWSWSESSFHKLLEGEGHNSRAIGKGPSGERLELWFNLTFAGWYAHRQEDRYSISKQRRPDLVINWTGPDGKSWLFLDAKYRTRRQYLEEGFESLHIYRDSLRWESYGGPPRGGLLISPRPEPQAEIYCDPEYQKRFHLGVVQLAPGTSASTLTNWVLAKVQQQTA